MFDSNVSIPPLGNPKMQTPEQRAQYLLEEQIQDAPTQKSGFTLPQISSLPVGAWLKSPYTSRVFGIVFGIAALVTINTIVKNAQVTEGTLPQVQAAVEIESQQNAVETLIQQATNITLGIPLEFDTAGTQMVLDTPKVVQTGKYQPSVEEILAATNIVMNRQLRELDQKNAGELMIAMQIGTANPNHSCYQLDLDGCIKVIQRGSDVTTQLPSANAEIANDAFLDRSLNLILNGEVRPSKFDADLYRLAVAKNREATRVLKATSPGGIASQILDAQSQIESTQP